MIRNIDYSELNDLECIAAMQQFVRDRRNQDRTIPRTVRMINTLGYPIDRETYKELEYRPLRRVEHIRAGILNYAYAALENNPTVNQDPYSYSVMCAFKHARTNQDLSYADVARMITDQGYTISQSEYRTCEEGTTKRVPLPVVIYGMLMLRVPPDSAFEMINDAFASGDY